MFFRFPESKPIAITLTALSLSPYVIGALYVDDAHIGSLDDRAHADDLVAASYPTGLGIAQATMMLR